jgi:AraC-like DNA-binding protein
MPIYMDVHYIPGVAAFDVAEAHQKDLHIQAHHHCTCMTYWVDVPRGAVFCLIDAPDKETVVDMHKKAHGLIPHKILEVSHEVVESFLGRIHDPQDAIVTDHGLKVFSEPAYRVLLVADTADHILLRHRLGQEASEKLLISQLEALRESVNRHSGRVVEHQGGGWIASFTSAAGAVGCALDIGSRLQDTNGQKDRLHLAVSGGDPVEGSDRLFGDALQLARRLCSLRTGGGIAVSVSVKNLLEPDFCPRHGKQLTVLAQKDENLMNVVFDTLEKHAQDPAFGVEQFATATLTSKSHLYRKTMDLWNMSPNDLLRRYRLDKARELLRKQASSISGVTFDAGFTSPSYFTKIFKQTFGVLPAAYLQMV